MRILNLITLSLILLLASCKKEGCTDSYATNHNEDAKKDDGTCLYDISGVWNVSSYIYNGLDYTSSITTYRITVYEDYSFYSELLIGTQWEDVLGTVSVNSDQTQVTFNRTAVNYYDGNGYVSDYSSSTFNISELDNNTFSGTSTDGSLSITMTK